MQMGQQQCVKGAPGGAGGYQTLRHAGAAVDQDLRAVGENELRRPVTFGRSHRTAGAKKDDFHGGKVTEALAGARETHRSNSKVSHWHHRITRPSGGNLPHQ